MSRPNKCIKDENGNDVWISRSNVVIPIVFKLNEETGDIFTLVEKEGQLYHMLASGVVLVDI